MPVHDWCRVTAGTFHNFHVQWLAALANALNAGILPAGYFAMAEKRGGGPIPDVVALDLGESDDEPASHGAATATRPQTTLQAISSGRQSYNQRANRLTIRSEVGRVVAIIEIVSPGNKDSRNAIGGFLEKVRDFLACGIHVALVDVFPPTPRDPEGLHKALWDDYNADEVYAPPAGKNLVAASYHANGPRGFIEPFAVGDVLPSLPLFLAPDDRHVPCPLAASYDTAWSVMPPPIRRLLPALPGA